MLSSVLPLIIPQAPNFVLSRFPGFILGVISGYVFMLLFFSSGSYPGAATKSFFSRLFSVVITLSIAYILSLLCRRLIKQAHRHVLDPLLSSSSPSKIGENRLKGEGISLKKTENAAMKRKTSSKNTVMTSEKKDKLD